MGKTWKDAERKIASMIGGRRVPVTGRGRGDAPDIEHRWLAPEIKTYAERPPSIHEAMAQARSAAREGKLPVAIFHKLRTPYTEAIVMMSLADFLDWFGRDTIEVEHAANG